MNDGPISSVAPAGRHSRPPPRTNEGARWLTVTDAARHLGVTEVSLRRLLERNARKGADGAIQARVDGLTGRKIGRLWRVWLSPAWSVGSPRN
jgi:hypothetical protein